MKKLVQLWVLVFSVLFICCQSKDKSEQKEHNPDSETLPINKALGKLFIIGGGKKSDTLISELIQISNLKADNYMVILPMASEEPDSAVYYTAKQFIALGVNPKKIRSYNFDPMNQTQIQIDSLEKASLIFITGGDQNLFMQSVLRTKAYNAIHAAYQKGATIAGTSAGAAVMSEKMISGNEFKYPEYTGDFRTIEAENFEIKNGLGLLPNVIVDQHFIKRMRMNRLLSVALENPDETAVGIDEATALVIQGDSARVTGDSQIVLIQKRDKNSVHKRKGLLGSKKIILEILLPGEKFKL